MGPTFTREEIVCWLGVVAGVCAGYHEHRVCWALALVVFGEDSRSILSECGDLAESANPIEALPRDARELLTIRALLRAELARRMGR